MKKIILIAIVISVIIVFFIQINYKKINLGNNITSKSADETKKYILGINSYEAISSVSIESNKNKNTYLIKEQFIKNNNVFRQEVIEPDNINGIVFLYDGTNLNISNTKLNLSKIYEHYPYIGENNITLMGFINDYVESNESNMKENDDEIILETKVKQGNKYISYKKLYISKETGNPSKMEIQDITQNTLIYILYNEIKINNLQEQDVLAFKLNEFTNDI